MEEDIMPRRKILTTGAQVIRDLHVRPDILTDLFRLILITYAMYPASYNPNKFICGGSAEVLFINTIRLFGYDVVDKTAENAIDLSINSHTFSLKTATSKSPIVLKNFRGNKNVRTYAIPDTFILHLDQERGVGYVMLVTAGVIESSDFNGEKIKIQDSNISLTARFLAHLKKTLDHEMCIQVPLPKIPEIDPTSVIERFIVPSVQAKNQELLKLQTLQHDERH